MDKKLLLLIIPLFIFITGCNEKVSPNLQSSSTTTGSSTTSSTSTVVPPTTYYFGLTNQSDTLLGYKLHQTGSGNATTECKISSTTELSNANYIANQSANDINCYFEAEELSLHFNGLSLSYDASQSTCDYVGYSPFSYFDLQPGNSTATYAKIICGEGASLPSSAQRLAFVNDLTVNSGLHLTNPISATPACNQYIDITTGTATTTPRSATTVTDLCDYNYETDTASVNCDSGEISVIEYTLDGATTTPNIVSNIGAVSTTKCGGKTINCVSGAIRQETELNKYTRGTMIARTTLNSSYTRTLDLPSTHSLGKSSNKYYINYRRDLASSAAPFNGAWAGPYDDGVTGAAYMALFNTATTFSPAIFDRYARNRKEDSTSMITAAMLTRQSLSNGHVSVPYAAEPYLGVSDAVNPYYTFYCFDNAFDVKARIRLFIREWDRTLPTTNTTLELISDINAGTSARQDIPGVDEISGENDPYNAFNDLGDWDDLLPMARAATGVTYYYEPVRGFWESANFPGELLTD